MITSLFSKYLVRVFPCPPARCGGTKMIKDIAKSSNSLPGEKEVNRWIQHRMESTKVEARNGVCVSVCVLEGCSLPPWGAGQALPLFRPLLPSSPSTTLFSSSLRTFAEAPPSTWNGCLFLLPNLTVCPPTHPVIPSHWMLCFCTSLSTAVRKNYLIAPTSTPGECLQL